MDARIPACWLPDRSEPVAEGTGNARAGQAEVVKMRCIPSCIPTSRAPFDLVVPDSTVRLCRGLQRREVRRPQTDPLADKQPDAISDGPFVNGGGMRHAPRNPCPLAARHR
jgi:hypothetical protein